MMASALKLLATLVTASALVVVRDGTELKAALANGAPAIELAADAYLEGAPAVVASAVVIDGRGFTVSQAGALHFLVNGTNAALELRDLTLATVDAPTAVPTCAPTAATRAPTRYVEPLALTGVIHAGLDTCTAPFCTKFRAAAGGGTLALSISGTPFAGIPSRGTPSKMSTHAPTRVYLKGGGVVDLPRAAEKLYADEATGAVIAQVDGALYFVNTAGHVTSHAFPRPLPQASRHNLALIELSGAGAAVVESDDDTVTLSLYRASAGEPLAVRKVPLPCRLREKGGRRSCGPRRGAPARHQCEDIPHRR